VAAAACADEQQPEREDVVGTMGQVWRAVDDDSGEEVAVKLIGRDLAPSPRARRRFRKEARLLSELQHPGVARAIESGELDDGTLFLATELARGRSLGSVLKERGPLPEAEAVALIVDLARALAEVHEAGIVHRDIKPENIIVVDDDPTTRVKLIDFGVARHLHEEGSLAMTRQGAVLGSPLYMPPEQARGDAVDGRSDLYALGTTLYEMLIGRAPFAGHGIAQVLAMQIEAPAPRVRGLRQELGEEIDDIVARLLEKDPAARYADARALLEALAPCGRGRRPWRRPALPRRVASSSRSTCGRRRRRCGRSSPTPTASTRRSASAPPSSR
jgi:serine/threonine protein kinase